MPKPTPAREYLTVEGRMGEDVIDRIRKALNSVFRTVATSFSTRATMSRFAPTNQISLASCISDASQTVRSVRESTWEATHSITAAVIESSDRNLPILCRMPFMIRADTDINPKPAQTASALFETRTRCLRPQRVWPSQARPCENPRHLLTGTRKTNCRHRGGESTIRTLWIALLSWRPVLRLRRCGGGPARLSTLQPDQLLKQPRRACASSAERAALMSGPKLLWMQLGNATALDPTLRLRF